MLPIPPVPSDPAAAPVARDGDAPDAGFGALLRAVLGGDAETVARAAGEGTDDGEAEDAVLLDTSVLAAALLAAPRSSVAAEEVSDEGALADGEAEGEGAEASDESSSRPHRVAVPIRTAGNAEAEAAAATGEEDDGATAETDADGGAGRSAGAPRAAAGMGIDADEDAAADALGGDDAPGEATATDATADDMTFEDTASEDLVAGDAAVRSTRQQPGASADARTAEDAAGDGPPKVEPAPSRGAAPSNPAASASQGEERPASASAQAEPPAPDGTRGEAPPRSERSALVNRVIDIAERLERSSPPRQMTVELGELRVSVSLRGDGAVRVAVLGDAASGLEASWRRDLADALAERGLDLQQEDTDDPQREGGEREGSRQRRAHETDAPGTRASAPRRPVADGALRL